MYPVGGFSKSAAVENLQPQSITMPLVINPLPQLVAFHTVSLLRSRITKLSRSTRFYWSYLVISLQMVNGDAADKRLSPQSNNETKGQLRSVLMNDSEDSTPCPYCEILYFESNCRWYQCRFFLRWACKKMRLDETQDIF
jgi:hypothetical protein